MGTVIHVAHHIDPQALEFLYHALYVMSGVVGSSVVFFLVARCCCKR